MKAWGLGSGRFRNPAPGAASRVTTAHERRVTGRYHSPPAWRVADRGATTCQLPGFPHDHTSVGRALGATELGLLGAGAVQLCALERRGVGVHFIRFLKQIVLEQISFQTRGLGTWASALEDGLLGTWVGAEQQVVRAVRGQGYGREDGEAVGGLGRALRSSWAHVRGRAHSPG